MLHLKTVVSRKTPLDGRLEIPESLARRLSSNDVALTVSLQGADVPARVEEMACTCAKGGAAGNHIHHFLASDRLKSLQAGANVSLDVDVDRGMINIESDD
jgi:hypothetical protein